MNPLKRFKKLIEIDKRDITQLFIYSILGGIISLSLPLGIQSIINFIQAAQISTSWIILVIIVVIGIAFVGVLKIMQYRISENIQQKIFVRSAFDFAYRFPKMKFEQLYNKYPPELANRFFDTITVQKGVSKLLLDVSTSLLQIIFGILLLSFYHTFFIIFGVLLLALLYFIFRFNFKQGLNTSLKESKYKYKVAHWLQEIARNHLSFKNRATFEFSLQKNDNLVHNYLKEREGHFKILRRQFIQLVGFKVIITAGLLIIGGLLVINQQMNIGQFVAAEIVILTISSAVEKLFAGLELFYDVLTSLEKLGSVADLEIEQKQDKPHYNIGENGVLFELENTCFKFPDAEDAILNNINLTIKPKEHILIQGENGSGKTTLLRLLARLIEPTNGTIYINNTNYNKYCIDEYRSKTGIITIQDTLFEGTLLENLTCNDSNVSLDKVLELIKVVNLTEQIKHLPLGLETLITSEGKQINSSMAQKILLIRTLLKEPELLFLEEPLDKIDIQCANKIIDYLTQEKHSWTLVVISKNSYWNTKIKNCVTLENGNLKK